MEDIVMPIFDQAEHEPKPPPHEVKREVYKWICCAIRRKTS